MTPNTISTYLQAREGTPLISVCIPVYNAKDYIEGAIRSVIGQHYPNLEICVQDNMSTDGTWEILGSIEKEFTQLAISRNDTNVGMAQNWNIVMNRARGEYVILLSADDFLEAGFLNKCLEIFNREMVSAVTVNHFVLTDGLKRKRIGEIPEGIYKNFGCEIMLHNPFSINFTLFKKDTIERLKNNDTGSLFIPKFYTCDYDLWFRLAFSGMQVYYLNEPLATYRLHEKNLSNQTITMYRQNILVLLSYGKRLKKACPQAYRWSLLRSMSQIIRAVRSTHYLDIKQLIMLFTALLDSFF